MEKITIANTLETPLNLPTGKRNEPVNQAGGFGETLTGAIEKVNKLQNEADQAITRLASGEEKDIHQTMIAMEKADVSFRLMMQVRNKIITAYQEVMRMAV